MMNEYLGDHMRAFWKKSLLVYTALSVAILFSAGCASGGFKLTRQYARWVNSQNIILRIIIYILTGIVFAVTLLIDMVVFNTMDFWNGTVSQGDYNFKGEDKVYHVKHEILPGTLLKRSTINVFTHDEKTKIQKVVLNETPTGEIEMFVDDKIRARVKNISSLPVVSVYNKAGQFLENQILRFDDAKAIAKH